MFLSVEVLNCFRHRSQIITHFFLADKSEVQSLHTSPEICSRTSPPCCHVSSAIPLMVGRIFSTASSGAFPASFSAALPLIVTTSVPSTAPYCSLFPHPSPLHQLQKKHNAFLLVICLMLLLSARPATSCLSDRGPTWDPQSSRAVLGTPSSWHTWFAGDGQIKVNK